MDSKVLPRSLVKTESVAEILLLDEFASAEDTPERVHVFNPNASLRIFLGPKASRREEKELAAKLRRQDSAARKVFKTFDLDGDGTIAVSELRNLAEALKRQHVLSESAITQMMEEFSLDGELEFTFQEFKDFFDRYNEERLAEHQRESTLMRKRLSSLHDAATVSSSNNCGSMCVGTIQTGCCVYHKQLLLLASMAVMAAMIPLLGTAYTVRTVMWQHHFIFYVRRTLMW